MSKRDAIIAVCKSMLGLPYVWGGESMSEGGFDCSGFVYYALNKCGAVVPRTTSEGYRKMCTIISDGEVLPGDLLFYGKYGTATHIAIYAGDRMMYESIGTSSNNKNNPGKGVTYSKMSRRSDLLCAGRIFNEVAVSGKEELVLDNARWQYIFVAFVQDAVNVEITGINTAETLIKTPTISKDKNNRHPCVYWVQQYLNRHGFDCGKEDGIAGNKFKNALSNYQKKHNCVVDGEMTSGKTTWKKMLGGL